MRRVLCSLLLFLLSLMVTAPGRCEEKEDKIIPHNGTASGAIAAGVKNSLEVAEMSDADPSTFFSKYQETYGPAFNGIGLNIKDFIRGKNNDSVIWFFIKYGMVAALCLVCVHVAYSTSKGNASFSDFGFAIGKTFVAAVILSFPGIIYMVALSPPVWFSNFMVKAMDGRGGTHEVDVDYHISEGMRASSAYFAGAVISMRDDMNLAYSADTINQIVKQVVGEDARKKLGIEYVKIPFAQLKKVEKNGKTFYEPTGEYKFYTSLDQSPIERPNSSVDTEIKGLRFKLRLLSLGRFSDAELRRKQLSWDESHRTALTKSILETADKVFMGWFNWQECDLQKDLKKIRTDKIRDMYETTDPDTQIEAAKSAAIDTHDLMEKQIESILYKCVGFRDSMGMHTDIEDALVKGASRAGTILDRYKSTNRSWGGEWIKGLFRWIKDYFLTRILTCVGVVWLIIMDVLMLNYLFTLPFWIHPKTETGSVKALKKLVGASLAFPLFLIGVLLSDVVSSHIFNVSGLVGSLLLPFKFAMIISAIVLPPIAGIGFVIMFYNTVFKGASLLGGFLQQTMGAVGTTIAMAVPAARVVGMAGAAASKSMGQGMENSSKAPVRAAGTVLKHSGRALDRGQKALGQMTGADEKYMSRDKKPMQNLKGAAAATAAAAYGGLSAAKNGGGASKVFGKVNELGVDYDKRQQEKAGQSKNTDSSVDRQVRTMEAVVNQMNDKSQNGGLQPSGPADNPRQPILPNGPQLPSSTLVQSSPPEKVMASGGADSVKPVVNVHVSEAPPPPPLPSSSTNASAQTAGSNAQPPPLPPPPLPPPPLPPPPSAPRPAVESPAQERR